MKLKPINEQPFVPLLDKLVTLLSTETQNFESDIYYRNLSCFYMAQVATNMRVRVVTPKQDSTPVNVYACLTGKSGSSKGVSMSIFENSLLKGFYTKFKQQYASISYANIEAMALHQSQRTNEDYDELNESLIAEFDKYGSFPLNFAAGTAPAIAQIRAKAQLAGIGSMTAIIDEIGVNMTASQDIFAVGLDSYDSGLLKAKVTKNSADNTRTPDRGIPVPNNLLAFGTASKLFDGAQSEALFMAMLDTGYGRRFIYGQSGSAISQNKTAEEILKDIRSMKASGTHDKFEQHFTSLMDPNKLDTLIDLPDECALILIQYHEECKIKAASYPLHQQMLSVELEHRYWKTLKVAGAIAFCMKKDAITPAILYCALRIIEDSGEAYRKLISRPKSHVRLARFIADSNEELTQADIVEALPFYKGAQGAKADMMNLAISWGTKNHIVIKKYYDGDIELFKGEAMKENDLSKLILSYSGHKAFNYKNSLTKWSNMEKLLTKEGLHWLTHHVKDGHRSDPNVVKGFNMIVIDCDGEVSLEQARTMLSGYKSIFHLTKSHTDEVNRFRIVMPLKYKLTMDNTEYKQFMNNIFSWLPFDSDEQTGQRARKWATCDDKHNYFDGELLCPLQFIPQTIKNEEYTKELKTMKNLDSVKRWFATKMETEGRNNTLLKYAMMLKDNGQDLHSVELAVSEFNGQLKEPLEEEELRATIFVSLAKAY